MKKVIAIVAVFAMLALVVAVPVEAETAQSSDNTQDLNALTIAIVTLPYKAEGLVRMKNGLMGVDDLGNFSPLETLQGDDGCEEQTLCVVIVSPNDIVITPKNIEHIRCIIEERLAEIWETIGRDGVYVKKVYLCSDSNDNTVTIGVVTLPHSAEGLARMKNGLMEVEKTTDSTI